MNNEAKKDELTTIAKYLSVSSGFDDALFLLLDDEKMDKYTYIGFLKRLKVYEALDKRFTNMRKIIESIDVDKVRLYIYRIIKFVEDEQGGEPRNVAPLLLKELYPYLYGLYLLKKYLDEHFASKAADKKAFYQSLYTLLTDVEPIDLTAPEVKSLQSDKETKALFNKYKDIIPTQGFVKVLYDAYKAKKHSYKEYLARVLPIEHYEAISRIRKYIDAYFFKRWGLDPHRIQKIGLVLFVNPPWLKPKPHL